MKGEHTTLIKERLSIAEVVGSYVKLERAGNNFKACCPFHTEKTPSFFVVPDKNIFHCFGCGRGGDIFTFVEEIESCDFPEALALLAERAGVTIDKREFHEKGKYDRLYKTLELATRYFEVNMRKDSGVVEYLLSRGLTKETIKDFRIGYARTDWQGLSDRLRETGVTDTDLVETGLAVKKDRIFDRFRNRIMFPLADTQGRIVGFSGRLFDARKEGNETAKYINSPETSLYHKSTVLYGFDKAKRAIRDTNACLLVEGQFDVVLAHQAGTTHTVALSGTGLSSDHCRMIKRFADTLVLALDGDEAGLRASRRSVLLALAEGLSVSILQLPAGEDPASIIARSADDWHALLAGKIISVLDLELSIAAGLPADDRKQHIHENIFPLIHVQSSALVQDQQLIAVAHAIAVSPDALRSEYQKWFGSHSTTAAQSKGQSVQNKRIFTVPMKFCGIMATLRQSESDLFEQLKKQYESFAGTGSIESLLQRYEEHIPEYSFVAEHEFGSDKGHIERVAKELLGSLEMESIEDMLRVLHSRIHGSESDNDEVLREVTQLTMRLHELKLQRSVY